MNSIAVSALVLVSLVFVCDSYTNPNFPTPEPCDGKCPDTINNLPGFNGSAIAIVQYHIFAPMREADIGKKTCLTSNYTVGEDGKMLVTFSFMYNGKPEIERLKIEQREDGFHVEDGSLSRVVSAGNISPEGYDYVMYWHCMDIDGGKKHLEFGSLFVRDLKFKDSFDKEHDEAVAKLRAAGACYADYKMPHDNC